MIPLWIDLLAVGIGSVQGAAFAAQFRDRRLDLLGVAIIGIATGFGGGIIRDILLNQVPLALQSNWYLPVATVAALIGMLLQRVVHRLGVTINVLDAVTIGMFGAIGTTKALALGLPVVPAIFGTTTLVVLDALGVDVFVAGLVCVIVTFGVRVLAVAFHWTLPEQRHLPTGP